MSRADTGVNCSEDGGRGDERGSGHGDDG
jgi:hypothetical protein